MTFPFRRAQQTGLLAAAILALLAGCMAASSDDSKSKQASKSSVAEKGMSATPVAEKETPKTPPVENEGPEDQFTVPDGTPEELLDYLKRLRNMKPKAETYASLRELRTKQARTMVTLADKILSAKASPEQVDVAVDAMLTGLFLLKRMGDSNAATRLESFPAELKKAGNVRMAREVEAVVLQQQLVESRVAEAETLLGIVKRIEEYLNAGPIGGSGARLAQIAAEVGQSRGDKQLAADINRQLGEALGKSDNQDIAMLGQQMVGTARRLELVGKPLELEGETATGDQLKWADYRGKVTLVVFWATWCPSCIQELAAIREYYQQYHDRGFEVVAVSVDEDRQKLEKYLEQNEMPWTVVVDQQRRSKLPGQSMDMRYGIRAIPEAFLVDRQGTVLATEVRGPKLGELLTGIFGPEPPKKEEDSKTDSPPAPQLPTLE